MQLTKRQRASLAAMIDSTSLAVTLDAVMDACIDRAIQAEKNSDEQEHWREAGNKIIDAWVHAVAEGL
jgi:hypothetical protein